MGMRDTIQNATVTLQEHHALLKAAQDLALGALMVSVGEGDQGLSTFMAQGSLNLAQQIKDVEQRLVRTDS